MILKRTESDGVVKAIYKSSNVLASEYNKATGDLKITFNKGTVYTYADVPNTDYTRFEIAESQGVVLNRTIKKYTYSKGDDIDPAKIVSAIDTINTKGVKALEEAMIKQMDKTIKYYAKNSEMDTTMLKDLNLLMAKFQSETNE